MFGDLFGINRLLRVTSPSLVQRELVSDGISGLSNLIKKKKEKEKVAWTPDNITGLTDSTFAFFSDPSRSSYKDATPSNTPSEPASETDSVSTLVNESEITNQIPALVGSNTLSRPILMANGNLGRPSGTGYRTLRSTTFPQKTIGEGFTLAGWMKIANSSFSAWFDVGNPYTMVWPPDTTFALSGGTGSDDPSHEIILLESGEYPVDGASFIFTGDVGGWEFYLNGVLIKSDNFLILPNRFFTSMRPYIDHSSAQIGRIFMARSFKIQSSEDAVKLCKWLNREDVFV